MMDTITKLLEITSRIEHLENAAEWIARETAQRDNTLSQTGTMIFVLADDIRQKVCDLVKELEEVLEATIEKEDLSFH